MEYNYIDLGLSSGTLWADRNVGASSPEDAGLYFAWGETQGYTAAEVGKTKQFSWTDYKYANGASDKLTKYCNDASYGNDGYTDSLTTLEAIDDAVLRNMYKYSMPTKVQLQELIDETDVYCIKADSTEVHSTYSEKNQIIVWDSEIGGNEQLSGIEFRKKTDSSVKVFFPCAGFGGGSSMSYVGLGCFLWSTSLCEDDAVCAWSLGFDCVGGYCVNGGRCHGLCVRSIINR